MPNPRLVHDFSVPIPPRPLTAAEIFATPITPMQPPQRIAYYDDWVRASQRTLTREPLPDSHRPSLERIVIAMLMDNLGIDHLDIPNELIALYRPRFTVKISLDGQYEEVHVKLEENALPA